MQGEYCAQPLLVIIAKQKGLQPWRNKKVFSLGLPEAAYFWIADLFSFRRCCAAIRDNPHESISDGDTSIFMSTVMTSEKTAAERL